MAVGVQLEFRGNTLESMTWPQRVWGSYRADLRRGTNSSTG
jgi:hypothetical protein